MKKTLDFSKSVYELTKEYPELIEIMKNLGFTEIIKPAVLHSAGRLMTVPRGAAMKGISMMDVMRSLAENGFVMEKRMPEGIHEAAEAITSSPMENTESRTEQLKGYLRRLCSGENLKNVRSDFVKEFSDVEAAEIMKAEQDLLKEGTPLEEVQRLCDIHSALFHGATREERIMNAEKAVEESVQRQLEDSPGKGADVSAYMVLANISGHPLDTFTKENQALEALIPVLETTPAAGREIEELLEEVRKVSIHYAKKGDLLYPLLKVRYEISGPSNVMWTVDDEIRDELSALAKISDRNQDWMNRLKAVLGRAKEMIYKEKNILFPICAANFSEEEWMGIYQDSKDYDSCFGVSHGVWEKAESKKKDEKADAVEGEIVMPGGHMTVPQLTALLNTIPMEISFVDDQNINRYFNEGSKVFHRASMAIDREVFSCHPPKIEPMVRAILRDFRTGSRDSVPVWMEKNGRTMLVTYMAVRDHNGNYVGTAEFVQDMEFVKKHFGIQS